MREDELERVLRDGLDRRSRMADVTAPVADRARAAARRRRGRRLAAASAVAVAAVAVTAVVVNGVLDGRGAEEGSVADGTHEAAPAGWRTEYWHDLRVDVPADWGWGSAPAGTAAKDAWCGGPGAEVTAGGRRLAEPDASLPYVGRPIAQTDMCQLDAADQPPRAPYVWLGADVAPGSVDLGDGYVRETREVNGSTVSVAARDAGLRDRVLDSAAGGETCFSDLEGVPSVRPAPAGGIGRPRSVQVCAYRPGEGAALDLVYADALGAGAAQAFVTAVRSAPPVTTTCADTAGEVVVLTVRGAGKGGAPHTRDYVVDLGCPGVEVAPGERRELTRAAVEPWAVDGVATVLTGPVGGNDPMTDLFIGMQG